MTCPQKISFGEMREMGVRDVLIYCRSYRCGHSVVVTADQWPDNVRLSDIEDELICDACGSRGMDVRPDFTRNKS